MDEFLITTIIYIYIPNCLRGTVGRVYSLSIVYYSMSIYSTVGGVCLTTNYLLNGHCIFIPASICSYSHISIKRERA